MKRHIKKAVVMILVLAVCLSLALPGRAATIQYRDPTQVSGWDYTEAPELAAALDEIFAGDAGLYTSYSCTATYTVPLGNRVNNSTQYFLKNQATGTVTSGWQCYAYANAVYSRLFGEVVGHANALVNSEIVIPGGASTVSYELFAQAGVRCGAYLRTTSSSSGNFSGSYGHSLLILSYDEDNICYLEGNGDGYGMVQVVKRDWASFNRSMLTNKGRYICHVVQPTAAYYQEHYPVHDFDGTGLCAACGLRYDWAATLDSGCAGTYQVSQDYAPRTDMPYEEAYQALTDLRVGQSVQVRGEYLNAFGQKWYQIVYGDDRLGYVPAGVLDKAGEEALEVTCDDFSPADQSVLEKTSHPVIGTVVSNYPLKAIYGYLDGAYYTAWTADDEETYRVSLRDTEINDDLTFRTLADGKHTLKLVAMSYAHTTPVTFLETVFYMVGDSEAGKTPGKPSLLGLQSQYQPGQSVSFTWNATENTTHYELRLSKLGADGQWSQPDRTVAASGLTQTLAAGEYRAVLRAYNSAASNTYTDSGEYFFTVLAEQYTVSFDPNGGDKVPASQLKTLGVELVLTLEVPAREGYCFLGWAVDAAATEPNFQPGDSYTTDADVTLYALWQEEQVPEIQMGDINGDGRINTADVAKLYAHVRQTVLITDGATLARCDLNEDGRINTADVAKLYAIVRGVI